MKNEWFGDRSLKVYNLSKFKALCKEIRSYHQLPVAGCTKNTFVLRDKEFASQFWVNALYGYFMGAQFFLQTSVKVLNPKSLHGVGSISLGTYLTASGCNNAPEQCNVLTKSFLVIFVFFSAYRSYRIDKGVYLALLYKPFIRLHYYNRIITLITCV